VQVFDSTTLKLTLPSWIKITPGQSVLREILEMTAAYHVLKNDNVLSDVEGCCVQLGAAKVPAEGGGAQFGGANTNIGSGTFRSQHKSDPRWKLQFQRCRAGVVCCHYTHLYLSRY
jgi:hypothetical protein